MFGARKKGKQQYTPPTASSVDPSAATAAVSAYNLSSAAAAAALRALPTPPTNVASVQTKRTVRRSASVSLEGSRRALSPVPSIKRAIGLGGKDTREGVVVSPSGAPTLRRRGSQSSIMSMSSMSERTFRSPSPHNPRAATLAAASASPNGSVNSNHSLSTNAAGTAAAVAASRSRSQPPPPPVPTIPRHAVEGQQKQQQQQQQQHAQNRKAAGLGFVQQPLHLASQKEKDDRSSWFGSAAVGSMSHVRTADAAMNITSSTAQPERPESRSSLQNFSYPSRQRLGSPPPSPTVAKAAVTPAMAAAAAAPASVPPATRVRAASIERPPAQHPPQPKSTAAALRRSASTSRVTGRSNAAVDMTPVWDPNSRRMVPRAELLMLEQAILDAAEKPQRQMRKKKQQQGAAKASLAGSHLAQGTMTHAHGTAAPATRAELQHAQEAPTQPRPRRAAQAHSPSAPKTPTRERQLPKLATTAIEPKEKPTSPTATERDSEEPAPVPALSTSTSTPSSSVSSLAALGAAQLAAAPVTMQNLSSPKGSGFDGTLLPDDGRPILVKRPSIIHEESDYVEEEKEPPYHPNKAQHTQLSTAAAVVAAAGSRTARDDLDGVSPKHIHHPEQGQVLAVAPAEQERTQSISPERKTHFSPVVGSNLTIRRHSPPPRSISPRKSAMKHTSPPRDASPSDSASEANASQAPSDAASHHRKKANRVSFDEKTVVVSQSPVPPSSPSLSGLSSLPGASEAPSNSHTAHQPPSRSRSWFSNIGRSKKKTGSDLLDSGMDDDDVVMKPRPALPSFGSVRDKSLPAQQEERALVRPATDSQPHSQPASSSTGPSRPLETLGTSSDHAIGFILGAEHQTSPSGVRNTANTSRYREPLPPVVTSVDGTGYVSDSGSSSATSDVDEADLDGREHSPVLRFDEKQATTVPSTLEAEPNPTTASVSPDADQLIVVPERSSPQSPRKTVPAIAVSHPSQENLIAVRGVEGEEVEDETEALHERAAAVAAGTAPTSSGTGSAVDKQSPVRVLFDVPGMFPAESDSDSTSKASPTRVTFATASSPTPTRQNTFEPMTQEDDHAYSPQMPATVYATHMPTLPEETSLHNELLDDDDSESEVFSDAYEDLSDVEGDGFLSLDAVVESPIVPDLTKSHPLATSGLTASPSSHKSGALLPGPSPLAQGPALAGLTNSTESLPADPENEEDWDKIKAFWRALTTEKRAQLEKEAREEAATEADLDDESAAAKKPRRKKPAETRMAEKKAIGELKPAQQAPAAPAEGPNQTAAASRVRPTTTRDNTTANPNAAVNKPKSKAKAKAKAKAKSKAHVGTAPPEPLIPQQPAAHKDRTASAMPPKAAVGAVTRPRTTVHARTMSAESSASSLPGKSGVASLLPGALRRRGSDSSESSFKRSRSNSNGAASNSAAGVVGFRMSMRGESKSTSDLNQRSSRFSLRSLSPTGSANSSPTQFRKSMRDGTGSAGFASMDAKRMSSPPALSASTLRKSSAADAGGGFFSSLGKKRNSKLLQRGTNEGGGGGGGGKAGRSRFDSSDEEDEDDIFGSSRAPHASRRTASAGGAYTFRSRFVDSSDEDEIILDRRTVGRDSKSNKDHVVPKTLRGGGGGRMRSASARPASASIPKSPPLPEELEEEEEEARANGAKKTPPRKSGAGTGAGAMAGVAAGAAAGAAADKSNLGTNTLRRSRSGRGQLAPVSPMYSPTTTGAVGANNASTPTHRSSGILSVLRRKKAEDSSGSPMRLSSSARGNKIQRPGLMDSAARRDTQLERSTRELAAVRSSSAGSQGRRATNGDSSTTPRFVPHDDDSDDDDSEESAVGAQRAGASWPLPGHGQTDEQRLPTQAVISGLNEKKKKKFPALRRMFRLDD